jgi:conjugal transfer mating pair stabilization protein TraN
VTRACWSYERTLTCTSGAPIDECAALVSSGCTPASSTCKQLNLGSGLCEITQDTYTCPVAARTTTTASNCPANVYCLGTNCFNTSYTNDADFARSMSLMEAGREAGVYLDTSKMQVFKGEGNRCRHRLLKNCCSSDSAGAGMTNQSLFGTGFEIGLRRADEFPEPRVPLSGDAGLAAGWRFQRQLYDLWHHRRGQRYGTAGQFSHALFR